MPDATCTITITGGDEFHAENELELTLDGDTAHVVLRTLTPCSHFYRDGSTEIREGKADVPRAAVDGFLANLAATIDAAPTEEFYTEGGLRITVATAGDWSAHAREIDENEGGGGRDLEAVFVAIAGFVRERF